MKYLKASHCYSYGFSLYPAVFLGKTKHYVIPEYYVKIILFNRVLSFIIADTNNDI